MKAGKAANLLEVSMRTRSALAGVLQTIVKRIGSGTYPVDSTLPAERELAIQLGASRTTIRSALARLEQCDILKKVERNRIVIKDPNERPESLLKNTVVLITWYSQVLGVEPLDVFHATDIGAVQAIHKAQRHSVAIPYATAQEKVGALLLDPPDGVILGLAPQHMNVSGKLTDRLISAGIPTVASSDDPEWQNCDRVVADFETGAYRLTKHLLERNRTRILFAEDNNSRAYWMKARRRGYETAMREADLTPLPSFCAKDFIPRKLGDRQNFDMRVSQKIDFYRSHITGPDPVDAIMAVSDSGIFSIGEACRTLGKTPGQDLDIVGWDDYWRTCAEQEWTPTIPIATVNNRNSEIGNQLAKLLMARIAGELPDSPIRMMVQPELIITQ